MKKPLVFGNWKLNMSPKETKAFMEEFLSLLGEGEAEYFAIFPPAVSYTTLKESMGSYSLNSGFQNMATEKSGAFTGENSGEVLRSLGGTHVLLGHSERRIIFNENDNEIAHKFKLAQSLGLIPVLCVGEELPHRESGHTKDVICGQLVNSLAQADFSKPFILAYEPVWAIGTGRVATPEQAEEAHLWLREKLASLAGVEVSGATSILYGGSVKADNSKELFSQKNIDGFLVGGASLKAQSFYDIFKV